MTAKVGSEAVSWKEEDVWISGACNDSTMLVVAARNPWLASLTLVSCLPALLAYFPS